MPCQGCPSKSDVLRVNVDTKDEPPDLFGGKTSTATAMRLTLPRFIHFAVGISRNSGGNGTAILGRDEHGLRSGAG